MIRLLLLSILFSALSSSLPANLAHPTNIYSNHQIITEPNPNFGYKKVKDKAGYNFRRQGWKKIFFKAVIDGYPLSETYFAIVGKNKKYALVDKEEKYITNKLMPPPGPKVISHNEVNYIFFNAKGKIHVLDDHGKHLDTIENARFGYNMHSGTEYFDLLTMDKKPIRYNLLTKKNHPFITTFQHILASIKL